MYTHKFFYFFILNLLVLLVDSMVDFFLSRVEDKSNDEKRNENRFGRSKAELMDEI